MRRALSSIVVVISALVPSACSSSPDAAATEVEPTRSVSSAIQGGDATLAANASIALCVGSAPYPSCRFFCSGTLIAPNLVVTARHCVQNVPSPPSPACGVDQFGDFATGITDTTVWVTTSPTLSASSTGWHRSAKIVLPIANTVCGGDLATIVLATDVPASDASPVALGITPSLPDMTSSRYVTLAGQGEIDGTDQGSVGIGTRRIVRGVPIECIPGDKYYDCAKLGKNAGRSSKEFLVQQGGCAGDSGGAAFDEDAFAQGKYLLLGALSRGATTNGVCNNDTYTRMDSFASFLERSAKLAATLRAEAVPAWASVPITGVQPGATTPFAFGALGAECDSDSDCTSNQCASNDDGRTYTCVEPCGSSRSCPTNFKCASVATSSICFYSAPAATPDSSGCSCSTIPAGRTARSWGVAILASMLVGGVAMRRRRTRAGNGRTHVYKS